MKGISFSEKIYFNSRSQWAGKSTLYQSIQSLHDMPRVNTDEILREIGDWRNMIDVMTEGKMAVKKIARYFDEGITFNQETTL